MTVRRMPLLIISAFGGNRKGDAEMPESHILLFQECHLNVEVVDTAEYLQNSQGNRKSY
ncbi:MAG: hypothetical protein Q9P14_06590 [candidate division KSB1 bacterium]|nr:hypothetical protein [candidate division KSB1 bacterium]MDQ7063095.1 hypothetical protein [candidate division KSB1 bacterium]